MLLKVNATTMPMPTFTNGERQAFWAALMQELPAFIWSLLTWQIPDELVCQRFGVKAFHHPALVSDLNALSSEDHLLQLIDIVMWNAGRRDWAGTSSELEATLVKSTVAFEARKVLSFPNAIGTFLGRLAKRRSDRVEQARTSSARVWIIRPPTMTP
jgi:hypothetical protein